MLLDKIATEAFDPREAEAKKGKKGEKGDGKGKGKGKDGDMKGDGKGKGKGKDFKGEGPLVTDGKSRCRGMYGSRTQHSCAIFSRCRLGGNFHARQS